MRFRSALMVTKGLIYAGGFGVLLPATLIHPEVVVLAVVWLVQRPQIIHRHICPYIFRHLTCINGQCKYRIPLVQFFQAENFRGGQPTHILRFRDDNGREARTLDCPKCDKTNPIQKARDCKLIRVTIIGNAFASSPKEQRPHGIVRAYNTLRRWWQGKQNQSLPAMPIGYDREQGLTLMQRLWRWITKQKERPMITIPPDVYQRHAVCFGASGMGKSTLFEWQIKWVMDNKLGCTVIDPAGRLIKRLLKMVPEDRKDDVILIRAGDQDCPFQLNPLASTDDMERFNIKGELLQIIRSVSGSWGEDIAYNLGKAVDTACMMHGSLRDAYDMLTKPTVRDRILPMIEDEELIEFWSMWEHMRPKSRVPTIRKLDTMMTHPILGPMLGASESNYSADEAIKDSKIVLIDLHSKSRTKEVIIDLGTIFISESIAASERQDDGKEVQHFVFMDEARNFIHKGIDLASMFSEARKRKLSLFMASQHPGQIDDVMDEVYGNAGSILSFKVDLDHAKAFKNRMPDISVEEIANQDVKQMVAKIHLRTHRIETQMPTFAPVDQTSYIEQKMRAMNKAKQIDARTGEGFAVALDTAVVEQDLVGEGVR